jgi:hypothetical protein
VIQQTEKRYIGAKRIKCIIQRRNIMTVEWKEFPKNKPKRNNWYWITVKDGDVFISWWNKQHGAFTGTMTNVPVIAFGEYISPEPFKPKGE